MKIVKINGKYTIITYIIYKDKVYKLLGNRQIISQINRYLIL